VENPERHLQLEEKQEMAADTFISTFGATKIDKGRPNFD